MKKFFTQILASSILVLFVGFSANAQTVHFEEQFDGGLNGWTVENIEQSDVDTLEWTYYPTGSTFVGDVIASPTAANGAMGVNFFGMRFGGDGANVPGDFNLYGEYVGELISPAIDLSDVTESLAFTFFNDIRVLNIGGGGTPRTSVSFSNDDGATWSVVPFDSNADLAPNAPSFNGMRTFNIPASEGLQGSPTVRIKFTYNMDFYHWTVDDVMIVSRDQVADIQANTNFFAIPPNYSTPMSQVEEFGFLVDVENVGGLDVENVNLNVTIENDATGAVVFEADQAYGTIVVDSLAENVAFGAFTPDAEIASYNGRYLLTSDANDVNLTNNFINYEFEVTEDLFSKENGATRPVRPAADDAFGYGTVFYVPSDGYHTTDITFGVSNAADLPAGSFIIIKLLEWQGDLNADGMATDVDEYSLVSFSGHVLDPADDNTLITVPINDLGEAVPLKANTYYVPLIEYSNDPGVGLNFLASDAFDYSAVNFATDMLGNPRYSSLLDVGNSGELSIIGFGGDIVPAVRMNVVDLTSTKELSDDNIVQIFPNPTAEDLNINLELIENAELVNIKIVDVAGKVHFAQKYENIQRTTLEYNLSNYTSGSYMVHIETAEGIRTVPFVVQK